jgi:peroxiredoxin (alkyl hydroperoxide reductase subunit C)
MIMAEGKDSCVKPARGPIVESAGQPESAGASVERGHAPVLAKVGRPAPDFEATAYYQGGYENIRLSDYRGQWVVLCFYPGDFTFV